MSILHLSQAIISPGQHLDCHIMKDPEPDSAKFSSLPSSDRPLFFNPGTSFICLTNKSLLPCILLLSIDATKKKKTLSLLNFRLFEKQWLKTCWLRMLSFPHISWGELWHNQKKKSLLDLAWPGRRKRNWGNDLILINLTLVKFPVNMGTYNQVLLGYISLISFHSFSLHGQYVDSGSFLIWSTVENHLAQPHWSLPHWYQHGLSNIYIKFYHVAKP